MYHTWSAVQNPGVLQIAQDCSLLAYYGVIYTSLPDFHSSPVYRLRLEEVDTELSPGSLRELNSPKAQLVAGLRVQFWLWEPGSCLPLADLFPSPPWRPTCLTPFFLAGGEVMVLLRYAWLWCLLFHVPCSQSLLAAYDSLTEIAKLHIK
jgi:hypothetical protein